MMRHHFPPFYGGGPIMMRQHFPPFYGGNPIMMRHHYPIWPLIQLIGIGLWIALFLLLVCGLISWLCRKKMRMFCGHGFGRCHRRSHGHGRCCHGHSHGRDRDHGHCGCHGYSHDQGGCHGYSHDHDYYPPTPPSIHLDALEILRRRYASGEIDDATFEHMRERLGPSTGPERPPEG
jgi:Short C-terminal domain